MFAPEKYIPSLSLDCVIFGFHNSKLKILLLKLKNITRWTLPGGFVQHDEDIDDAAHRILQNRTGLENIFLRQFYFFGKADRNSNLHHIEELRNQKVLDSALVPWFKQRFNTVGYFALVEFSDTDTRPDKFSDLCIWYSIPDLPPLILDHSDIIQKALNHLRHTLTYQPIGINLLPEKFTMPELQSLYEILLDKKLDRRNFRRKILRTGILRKLDERKTGGAHRAPSLYSFDKKAYYEAMEKGLKSGW